MFCYSVSVNKDKVDFNGILIWENVRLASLG